MLVPLLSGVSREVDDIGLLQVIRDCNFDSAALLIAYNRVSEVDWVWVEPAQRFNPYQLSSGQVQDVPEQ